MTILQELSWQKYYYSIYILLFILENGVPFIHFVECNSHHEIVFVDGLKALQNEKKSCKVLYKSFLKVMHELLFMLL